jgi:hypothetical protein
VVHRVRGIYLDSSRSSRANGGEPCRQRQTSRRGACSKREGRYAYTGSSGECSRNNGCSSRRCAYGRERDARAPSDCRYCDCRYCDCRYCDCGYCDCEYCDCRYCDCSRAGDGCPRRSHGRLHVRREAA